MLLKLDIFTSEHRNLTEACPNSKQTQENLLFWQIIVNIHATGIEEMYV